MQFISAVPVITKQQAINNNKLCSVVDLYGLFHLIFRFWYWCIRLWCLCLGYDADVQDFNVL